MKTASGTSVLPPGNPLPGSNRVSAAPKSDSSATFKEVLHQQGGDSSHAPDTKNPASAVVDQFSATNTAAPDTTATTVDAKPTAAPAQVGFTALSVASDLSAMLVQAAALASNPPKTAPAATTTANGKESNPGTPSDKDQSQTIPGGSDLAGMLAQALLLTSTAKPASAITPAIPATPDHSESKTDAGTTPQIAFNKPVLLTPIAQASIPILNSPAASSAATDVMVKVSASPGKDLPLMAPVKGPAASQTKEKKSASTDDEGTFLQSNKDGSTMVSSLLGMPGLTSAQGGQPNGGQQLATNSESKKSPVDLLSASASNVAGTANVEKQKAMNADLNIPQVLSGLGANPIAHANTSDMQIKLSTNNDFNDALKQVMHVAQLTQTNESRTPMRVAIEIQTPPGAVVNVYVSKQNDQWRAQLSTNDPQALSWVQDKMSTLRQSNDLGVQVRWLPPQMESVSTSSGNDANLSWDRGGQGQSNYQQPDERRQNDRQEEADDAPSFAAIGSNFMKKLTTAGSAA
jgi:hypothetical protein